MKPEFKLSVLPSQITKYQKATAHTQHCLQYSQILATRYSQLLALPYSLVAEAQKVTWL